jgi:hypothetical protein
MPFGHCRKIAVYAHQISNSEDSELHETLRPLIQRRHVHESEMLSIRSSVTELV